MELFAPSVGDLIIRNTWIIERYLEAVQEQEELDSEPFEVNINGYYTKWVMSIRFWKKNGKRIRDPMLLVLYLISFKVISSPLDAIDSSEGHHIHRVHLKYQFGLLNFEIGVEDLIPIKTTFLPAKGTKVKTMVGYQAVEVTVQNLDVDQNLVIKLKLQMLSSQDFKKPNLINDMSRMLIGIVDNDIVNSSMSETVLLKAQGVVFPVHRHIMACRSKVFTEIFESPVGTNGHYVCKMEPGGAFMHTFDLDDLSVECLRAMIGYAYTDQVKGLDKYAKTLLASADRYGMAGLKSICARFLAHTLEPNNVAALLLLAENCHCVSLKMKILSFCRNYGDHFTKSLAWKAMKILRPELFRQAREEGSDESTSSDSLY